MTTFEFAAAIAVLLITPGPTNTLLAIAGAERGFVRALRLIPAELAGYHLTVVPLSLAGGALLAAVPMAQPLITAVAAVWVAWLAIGLWHLPKPGAQDRAAVTARQVFVTTLLNPKALVFGLVLLPGGPGLPLSFAIFAGQIVLIATLWAALGHRVTGTRGAGAGLPHWMRRLAALWLAGVAALLAVRALAG